MHRWYIKARGQEDHDERAEALGCSTVSEDTSAPVNLEDSLPHVIIQRKRFNPLLGASGELETQTLVFPEPVEKSTLDAVPADDS